jgi:hypothetical protein
MNDKAGKEGGENDLAEGPGQAEEQKTFSGKFRVSAARLKKIGKGGNRGMENLDPEDIGNYSE